MGVGEHPFHRLAIVNRGEPAMRVIHAVRELNEARTEPIRTIALHAEHERHAMFVRHADESHMLAWHDRIPYLDYAELERALTATHADAVWVGWGFVAEHPAFVELCERLGIVFIGPSSETMRRLGDKIEAKRLAEAAGVPVAPWSGGPVDTGVSELSGREVEVLRLVADGQSNKQIGDELGLSALTVKSHLARIARKLGTGDRAEMVALAMRAGVIR